MSRNDAVQHALHQAAMWRRLAHQCRRCGDADLERDARMLSHRYLQQARLSSDDAAETPGHPASQHRKHAAA